MLLTLAVAAAGPSLMEPAVPGSPGQPPWSLALHPGPALVTFLSAAVVVTGAAGLALSMAGLRRGLALRPTWLLAAGLCAAVALAALPPTGSADPLSYAAYGAVAVAGRDPYVTTPAELARAGNPVARADPAWQASPSVYGPLATAGETLAARVGGTSARLVVFVLGLLNVAAFALTGLLLHGLARGDPRRQQRAALLWTANPLLLQVLVAGAHVDTQAVPFAVAAVAVFARALRAAAAPGARSRARQALRLATAAGGLAALAAAVKVTAGLAVIGLAVAGLAAPRLRRVLLPGLAVGFAGTTGAALAAWGPGALLSALRATSEVSVGSPWRPIRSVLRLAVGEASAESAVRAGAVLLAAALLLLLLRALAGLRASPAALATDGAALIALAVLTSWLFAWPYVLPWYGGLAWALLALCGERPRGWPDRLCWLLLAWTAALAAGYLPGRGCYPGAPACQAGAAVAPGLGWLESVVRTCITPVVLAAVTAALAQTAWPRRLGVARRMARQRRRSAGESHRYKTREVTTTYK